MHGDAARLGAAAAELAENVADRDRAHLRARHAGNFEHRHAAAAGLHLDLDFLVVELAGAQLLAEASLVAGAGIWRRPAHRARALRRPAAARACTSLRLRSRVSAMRDLDEIAHDLLDVAADIADLGEFRRLDLEERRAGELGEPARDLGLADAGRPDHQNVLRQHFFAQPLVELQAAPAIAQRDRDRALGVALADDEAVELGNDFAGREVAHASRTIRSARPIAGIDQALLLKAGLFIRPNGAGIIGIGVGHGARRAVVEEIVDEHADKGGAMALLDHGRVANELIDAARAGRL